MRVLLEGRPLTKTRDFGGVDSYWRFLVPALLKTAPPELRYILWTSFLNPNRTRAIEPYRQQGAVVRHYWSAPQWLDRLGRLGVRLEWMAGGHEIVHAVEPVWPIRSRSRLVITAHDLMYLHHPQFLDPRWVARLMAGTTELAERASFWICVSENTREELIRHFGIPAGRTQVVHHGVDERFRGASERSSEVGRVRSQFDLADRPYYLFLGSVEPKKNLAVLLKAFGLALARGLRSRLAVAGRAGWQSGTVRQAVEKSPQLQQAVRFLGFVDQEDLPPLVGGARALVLPSRWEGFGMPVLEAMAAGTPVLCSNRGALPEVAGSAARLFSPDDAEGLAELLLAVDEDDALWEDLRSAGLERARPFTWERCAEETLAAYRRALELPR